GGSQYATCFHSYDILSLYHYSTIWSMDASGTCSANASCTIYKHVTRPFTFGDFRMGIFGGCNCLFDFVLDKDPAEKAGYSNHDYIIHCIVDNVLGVHV